MKQRLSQLLMGTAAVAAFFSAAAFGQSPVESKPARVTGAITGRVINSVGDPLPGAVISASAIGSVRVSQTAKADANGNFKIDGLPVSVYRVFAGMPGYALSLPPSLSSQTFYHVGDTVTLTLRKGGVITGKVSGPNGPLIAAGVFAIRVRDEAGKRLPTPFTARERATDDRGIYRLYGLAPGSYLVLAARPRIGRISPTPYDNDMPTYFPSSPRDTAAEIIVGEGEEITADIQYRAESGRAVSGQVLGVGDSQYLRNVTVTLVDIHDRTAVFSVGVSTYDNFNFVFTGVPDGEYELSAFQYLETRTELRSAPRRVTLNGSDVSAANLTLAKQAAIEGRLVFESDAKNNCGKRRETAPQETVVFGRRYEPDNETDDKTRRRNDVSAGVANQVSMDTGDETGRFVLRNLRPGTHRIDPQAPSSGWYLRSITIDPTTPPARATVTPSRDSITIRAAETVSGLRVTFAEGAARIRGVVTAPEGQRLPASMFIYLVPAEKDGAANLFRFFESPVASDASFAFDNVTPGEYLIVALKQDADTQPDITIRFDPRLRNAVVREAQKLKQSFVLKPCERLDNFELPFGVSTKP